MADCARCGAACELDAVLVDLRTGIDAPLCTPCAQRATAPVVRIDPLVLCPDCGHARAEHVSGMCEAPALRVGAPWERRVALCLCMRPIDR